MTNSPKDLDQADVNRDAIEMYENEFGDISDTMDGCDLYSVLAIIHDAEDGGMEFSEFLSSSLAKDLIQFTQSDLNGIHDRLIRMKELDEAIASLS